LWRLSNPAIFGKKDRLARGKEKRALAGQNQKAGEKAKKMKARRREGGPGFHRERKETNSLVASISNRIKADSMR
jgi:hypothetical protein